MDPIEQLREMLVGFGASAVRKRLAEAERLERVTGEAYCVPLRRQLREVSTIGWTQAMLDSPLQPPETAEARPAEIREALGGMATSHDGKLCLLSKYTGVRG